MSYFDLVLNISCTCYTCIISFKHIFFINIPDTVTIPTYAIVIIAVAIVAILAIILATVVTGAYCFFKKQRRQHKTLDINGYVVVD